MTTHKYMEAYIEMKRRTLEKISEPSTEGYIYKPSTDVLFFLNLYSQNLFAQISTLC